MSSLKLKANRVYRNKHKTVAEQFELTENSYDKTHQSTKKIDKLLKIKYDTFKRKRQNKKSQ